MVDRIAEDGSLSGSLILKVNDVCVCICMRKEVVLLWKRDRWG